MIQIRHPIWARIAARILPTMAASTDVERFFKVIKGVSTDDRLSLSTDILDILACLNMWLTDLYEYGDSRHSKVASERKLRINSQQSILLWN